MSTPAERQQLALSQGVSAMTALRAIGVEAELVGSVVCGHFHASSDVDFLIIEDGGISDVVIYEAVASRLDIPFDLKFLSRLRPVSPALILKQRAEHAGRVSARGYLDTEFTDLDEPNLLSIGLASDDGDELYVELELGTADARDRIAGTCRPVPGNLSLLTARALLVLQGNCEDISHQVWAEMLSLAH